MPRQVLRWGPEEKFRAPIPPGMTLAEVAAKIEAEYAPALVALRDEVAGAYGIPPGLMPLAWFSDGGVVKCGPCSTDVEVGPLLLRCPDCGAVASKPESWPS